MVRGYDSVKRTVYDPASRNDMVNSNLRPAISALRFDLLERMRESSDLREPEEEEEK